MTAYLLPVLPDPEEEGCALVALPPETAPLWEALRILAPTPRKELTVYTHDTWRAMMARREELPATDRRLLEPFLSRCCEVWAGEGVLTVPEQLRRYAGIGAEVLLTVEDDRVTLTPPEEVHP